MTSTIFHLVRHGETVWHAENRYAGRSDIELTDLGREQAQTLAQWAAWARPNCVVSSTLGRAVATASPSAEALGIDLRTEAELCEVNFGRGEGMTRSEMEREFGADLARFHAQPATCPLPEGERGIDAINRARPVLDRLGAEHSGGTVLVVAHSTLLRLLICDLVGIDPDDYRRVLPRLDNAKLTTVRLQHGAGQDGRAQLLGLNVPAR